MEIQAKDLYFFERVLKEPIQPSTKAAQSEGSSILQELVCPRQTEALKVNPLDRFQSGATRLLPTSPNHPENVESKRSARLR